MMRCRWRGISVRHYAVLAGAALALAPRVSAQAVRNELPARVTWATDVLRLDGRLDESAWMRADSITDFTQSDPSEGEPASERTVVRLLARSDGLWVGVWAYDREPARIVHAQLRRDAELDADDFFVIGLDTRRDQRSGFLFAVNPNGAIADAEILTFESENIQWDGIWDARAHITSDGWVAEMFIPWQTLRYSAGATSFGMTLGRGIRRKNEIALWRAWKRSEGMNFLERYGVLEGLHDLPGRAAAELRPYATASSRLAEREYDAAGGSTVRTSAASAADAGIDAKLSVAQSLTLDLTYNTDFAQAEADRQVVNLSRFSLFFPETRQFFLEGSGIFEFGRQQQTQLFYSRRIGLDSERRPIPIVGGARLTGRLGREQVGLLAIRSGGTEDATDVVARVKHDILGRGYVGAMATARTAPGNAMRTSAGVDVNLPYIVNGQNLVFIGALATDRDSAGAPSAGYGRIVIDYPNDNADIAMRYEVVGQGFDPALGFVQQQGISRFAGQIELTPRPHRWGVRKLAFVLPSWDWVRYKDGSLSNANVEVRPLGLEFEKGGSLELNLIRSWDAPRESFELFPGTDIDAGRYVFNRVELQLESSSARPVWGEIQAVVGDFYDGNATAFEGSLSGRAQPHLQFRLDAEWKRLTRGSSGFTAKVLRLRTDYALSPRLNATFFGQWDNESERLSFNARVRFTRSPGSDAYVVWNNAWPSALDTGIPWRRPQQGALIVKYVQYFRR